LYQFTRRGIILTVVIIKVCYCCQLHNQNYMQYPALKVMCMCKTKLLGIISVGFDVTDEILVGFFAFVRYWKMGV
jgi:hypothetical protein